MRTGTITNWNTYSLMKITEWARVKFYTAFTNIAFNRAPKFINGFTTNVVGRILMYKRH